MMLAQHFIFYILMFMLIGAFAGFMAGLIGIGGGLLVVPGLAVMFMHMPDLPHDNVMHLAAGTSLAVMMITSLFAVLAHHRRGSVRWSLAIGLYPGIFAGVVIGALIAHRLPSIMLRYLFAAFVIIISIRMFMLVKPKPGRTVPNSGWRFLVGLLIGGKSGLLGVGGGAISVPFFTRCNVPMHNATATSSACSLFIAVSGSVVFALMGAHLNPHIDYSSGYIYWPAFLGVALFSSIAAPIGAHVAHRLPTDILKRVFAVFLMLVAVNLLLGGKV